MKKTLLFLLLVTINTYAQTNQNEAIAAYQLAEESYEKGDYKTTLRFLESAKKKLGTSNCKLLYLQIQAETELFKTDKNLYDQLMKTINAFQASPDIKSFNEVKVLEVLKSKMLLEDQHDIEAKKALETQVFDKEFKEINMYGWRLGSNIEELKKEHLDFFKKAQKSSYGNGIEAFIDTESSEVIFAKNNIVYIISHKIFNGPDDINFIKTKTAFNDLLSDLNKKLTMKPKETNTTAAGVTSVSYTWSNEIKSVTISSVFMTDLKVGDVTIVFSDTSF
jgi:hypothetical protein